MPIVSSLFKMLKENILPLSSKIYYSFQRRDNNIWVFGEWFGNRCCDNCLYFANYLSRNHPELHLYWISSKDADLSLLNKNVVRVEKDASSAVSILKKAGVVIYVQGMSDITKTSILYFSGALVVNLWHGVPWKKIGADKEKSAKRRQLLYMRMQYSLYGSKYYLALSKDFFNILKKAYYCDDQNIIKAGYPRNSLFYEKERIDSCRKKLIDYLKVHYDVEYDDSVRLICYMPTFRDHLNDIFSLFKETNPDLLDLLEQHHAVILEKSHFVTENRSDGMIDKGNRVYRINSDFIAQELLAASDLLITDYSSCFFDYLLLDRPIVHYLYDYHYYESDDRGLYYKKEDVVCGDVAENMEQLICSLRENLQHPEKDKALREKRRRFYMEYESSQACQQIYQFILGRLNN